MVALTVTATAKQYIVPRGWQLAATAYGGTGPYRYLWTCPGADFNASPAQPSPYLQVAAPRTLTATVVVADATGAETTAAVTFTAAETVVSVKVVGPESVTPGVPQQFVAPHRNDFGLLSSLPVAWSATNGTITPAGLFTAAAVGPAVVTATSGLATGSMTVAVAPPSVTVAFPPTILAGAAQAVTLLYAGVTPAKPPTVAASVGTVGSSATSGRFVTFLYTAPATAGPVTFTDATAGLSATATVSTSAPAIRLVEVALTRVTLTDGVAGGAPTRFDPDGDAVYFGGRASAAGGSMVRVDTTAIVGPPQNTPLIRASVGDYYYTVPDVAPGVTFAGAIKYLSAGKWESAAVDFTDQVRPAPGSTVTTTPLPVATTVAVDDCRTGQPIAGMVVWATSDAAGNVTAAGPAFTAADGTARLLLVPGTTYYLSGLKMGETPIVGREFVAVPDLGVVNG